MKTNIIHNTYTQRTAKPLTALVFLLPFIIAYEILIITANPQLLNNPTSNIKGGIVAFVWIQNFLQYLNMSTKTAWLFAPVVVIITLIILHLTSRANWKIKLMDLPTMAAECICLALPLIILSLVLNRVPAQNNAGLNNTSSTVVCQAEPADSTNISSNSKITVDIITGIGAGIYEELIFRLFLISATMIFLETVLGVPKNWAVITAITISAILFSLHHHFVYLNGHFAKSELFTIKRFIFRTIAGAFFAIIFATRGFGIAAGTHSFYNIMASCLNIWLMPE